MGRVNWSTVVSVAVKSAKARGEEANITQARNLVNDLAQYLHRVHTPGEIVDGVLRLSNESAARESKR